MLKYWPVHNLNSRIKKDIPFSVYKVHELQQLAAERETKCNNKNISINHKKNFVEYQFICQGRSVSFLLTSSKISQTSCAPSLTPQSYILIMQLFIFSSSC